MKVKESVIRKPARRILFSTPRAFHSRLDKDFVGLGTSLSCSLWTAWLLPLAMRGVLSSAAIFHSLSRNAKRMLKDSQENLRRSEMCRKD